MSQRDLAAELRAARVTAPHHVREQVRLIAAAATPPPRRFQLTRRRALVIALPAAAAIAAAVIVTRPSSEHRATPPVVLQADTAQQHGSGAVGAPTFRAQKSVGAVPAPAPSGTRAQTYGAFLSLRIPTKIGVSDGVKRVLSIASALGGYPVSVHASTETTAASADLTLKIPRVHVAEAITRLSALGTIIGEQVDVQDAQAGLNATDRLIALLQRQLAGLRALAVQTDIVKQKIAAITARIETLQRQEGATIRATRYATVRLHLATKPAAVPKHHGRGPLHGLGVAFRWIGIGAVYGLALGGPLVVLIVLAWLAARAIRRRREDALLNQA